MSDSLQTVQAVVPHAVFGVAAMAIVAILAWTLVPLQSTWWTRPVRWWLHKVVYPLLDRSSYWRRLLVIAVNNSIICGIMVLLGRLEPVGWFWIPVLGWSLGTALRMMPENAVEALGEGPSSRSAGYLFGLGILLNLLELPAIAISAGLNLGQGTPWRAIDGQAAWTAFLVVVVPLLVAAAAGEALWMTLGKRRSNGHSEG